jgi:Ca2+-binding EF-hand superfamily protein
MRPRCSPLTICDCFSFPLFQARSETPRTTNQSAFSNALLNRSHQSGAELHGLISSLPSSLDDRLHRGLKAMRETLYQKSSQFHAIFNSLATGTTKTIVVTELVPHLLKWGFPANTATEEELTALAMKSSIKTPGYFTYAEFLAFVTGHDASQIAPTEGGPATMLDSPALINALVKINNINLRKFFKELDLDIDGLISTAELARGLVESGGMHATLAKDPAFHAYLETYSKRKAGYFGYAEFIKFVNARVHGNQGVVSGQPLQAHSSVRIPDDSTPSQMLEMIVKTLRTSNLSVESMFAQFDSNMDGSLEYVHAQQEAREQVQVGG